MATDPLDWLTAELAALDALSLRRKLSERDGPQQSEIPTAGGSLVNFGSNDYLALANDQRVVAAAIRAAKRYGFGSGASPLITGRSAAHAELEWALADWEQAEAALLFSSGYAANVGTIAALVSRGDVIFSDERNHASIIDGCRLSDARVRVYPHGDLDYLEKMLAQAGPFRRRLIVTDSLFSMDGDLAPLPELAALAERYDAMLMVDEAHATGVFGAAGRGACEALGVESGAHVRIGTLSKGLGASGGFVIGSRQLIDWLLNRARPYVFSTAGSPATAAAALAAIEIVRSEPARRAELLARADSLRGRLRQEGWSVGRSASQIIPLMIGDPQRTMEMAAALRERGLLVPGIRPPTVPEGESLLRISLSWGHTPEMIEQLLAGLAAVRGER